MNSAGDRHTVEKGNASELRVVEKLFMVGFRDVRMCASCHPYDLEVDGRPVEVKYSKWQKSGGWHFTIRKPGRPLVPVIGYVLCVDGFPGHDDWTFIVIPGPVRKSSINISRESMTVGEYAPFVDNWAILQPEPYELRPRSFPKHMGAPGGQSIHQREFGGFLQYFLHFKGLGIFDYARIIGCPVREVYGIIKGKLKPSDIIMYSTGTRISRGDHAWPENPARSLSN